MNAKRIGLVLLIVLTLLAAACSGDGKPGEVGQSLGLQAGPTATGTAAPQPDARDDHFDVNDTGSKNWDILGNDILNGAELEYANQPEPTGCGTHITGNDLRTLVFTPNGVVTSVKECSFEYGIYNRTTGLRDKATVRISMHLGGDLQATATAPVDGSSQNDQGGGQIEVTQAPVDPNSVVLGDGAMDWPEFEAIAQGQTNGSTDAGPFVDFLDQNLTDVKVEFDQGDTLTTDANHVYAVWMGVYGVPDYSFGGVLHPYIVDGNNKPATAGGEGMGVFILQPNSSIVAPNDGAYVSLTGWNGNLRPISGPKYTDSFITSQNVLGVGGGASAISAASCVANGNVMPMIAALGNQDGTFIGLDMFANANETARLRSGTYPVNVQVTARQSFLWVRTGNARGPVAAGPTNDGKTLYLATDNGEVTMTHSFSGLQLCDLVTDPAVLAMFGMSSSVVPTMQPSPTPEGIGGGAAQSQTITDCVATSEIQSAFYTPTTGKRTPNQIEDSLATLMTRHPGALQQGNGVFYHSNTMTLVNVSNGNLPSGSFVKLNDTGAGSAWYLAASDGSYFTDQDWSTLALCGNLNPDRDFSEWWGK